MTVSVYKSVFMNKSRSFNRFLPPWCAHYAKAYVTQDLAAGLVVALMLIPQALAYATLAGLPPVYGLYASFLPLLGYALLGSSAVLSVGPMAITSLLTASALADLPLNNVAEQVLAAATLALLSGLFLLLAGVMRLGAIAQLLSHPVVQSFVSGAAVLIVLSQLQPLLGLSFGGNSTFDVLFGLWTQGKDLHPLTAGVGIMTLTLLMVGRVFGGQLLSKLGFSGALAASLVRLLPMIAIMVVMVVVFLMGWNNQLAVVGALPASAPSLTLPQPSFEWLQAMWLPALVIGLLGFIESVSIAQSFAIKARQPLNPNAELRALGVANIGSSLMQGFPVAGGFSRTLVNAEAGAKSPLAGVFTALFMLLLLLWASGLFDYLPITALAAMIIAASIPLIKIKPYLLAWRYDRSEAVAMLVTSGAVLLFGVEVGITLGVMSSLVIMIWRTSQPHMAVVGRVPGTQHFRNVDRHQVETYPELVMIRVDENLVFANAEAVYNRILDFVRAQPDCRHLVLLMSSVSRIDVTALEMLQHLVVELEQQQIQLHLAEVKGPVSDQLATSQQLTCPHYLSAEEAFATLGSETAGRNLNPEG